MFSVGRYHPLFVPHFISNPQNPEGERKVKKIFGFRFHIFGERRTNQRTLQVLCTVPRDACLGKKFNLI